EIVEKDVTPVRVMTSDEAVDTDEVSAPVMTTEENHALPATGVSESTPWMMLGTVLSALGFIVRPRKKND
ncbi:MAG: LPXTG cell wall anchor domain-containing protein, partial [Aerococcus suis]|nr:LPXTG cell wall anchor domain-containing protein [Aerococcus suis]